MKITDEQLLYIMPTAKLRVAIYLSIVNEWNEVFGITTPLRMAHYLAQIAHESGEFRYTKELASGKAYEGRTDLGNTYAGDGVKFKGRGLIQLTGRANYLAYGTFCGCDICGNPDLLEKPLDAVKSSMWFWQTHGLNALADKDDVRAVTRRINGGHNGLEKRKMYLERAKKILGI